MKRHFVKSLLLLTLLLAGCAGGAPPLTLARSVDLPRYMGKWYIVAEIPYWGERGNVGSTATYRLLPDGAISDAYFAHEGSFTGKIDSNDLNDYVVAGTNDALWRVCLFWPIYVSYDILHVDPGYQYAVVGYPDRSLGWIFARHRHMDNATYHALLGRFAAEGYDIGKFQRVPQFPAEVGKPGFHS